MGISRSGYYYEPEPIDKYTLELMNEIDKIYTDYPFYGSPRITETLKRIGYEINIKRVKRLMRNMDLMAIYPGSNTSKKNHEHQIYPYLLKDKKIIFPNQVWCADITYIRMKSGFLYLMAIMDWYSRYVISWEISNTLDTSFCITALNRAFDRGNPDIFNTDQGSQFTSKTFTEILLNKRVNISMDSSGRVFDNIFIERLWRSVKYENIYIMDYETVLSLKDGLKTYFKFYNTERLHQSLNYKTPSEIYFLNRKAGEKQ